MRDPRCRAGGLAGSDQAGDWSAVRRRAGLRGRVGGGGGGGGREAAAARLVFDKMLQRESQRKKKKKTKSTCLCVKYFLPTQPDRRARLISDVSEALGILDQCFLPLLNFRFGAKCHEL